MGGGGGGGRGIGIINKGRKWKTKVQTFTNNLEKKQKRIMIIKNAILAWILEEICNKYSKNVL